MCEGRSSICGPIPPDPSLFPQYYNRPASAQDLREGIRGGTLALLSGPLAPDPVLHPDCYNARTSARHPRISPNASHIQERGQRGVVRELLKLDIFPTTEISKPKERKSDFRKENVRRLRDIQRRCKELEAERARSTPVKALWTSPKYQNVPSKFMTNLQVSSPTVKPQCQDFLRSHSNNKCQPLPRPRSASSVNLHRSKSCSPIGEDNLQLQVRGQSIDFIKYNAKAAGKTMQRSQSMINLRDKPVASAVIGQVPHYLEERKKQWREEEERRRKNAVNPSIPPGHTLMADSERQDALKSLKESHRTLVTELLLLPLKADNLGVRTRRTHLDRKLSEIEEAIKIFSRDKVYVKINS
ncbi:enkurin domain-containing protein 1 [Nerophis lumbriciformis]|uniref:enkurin domain-containing protein 1 n=1 Tax=Nerophis lumbriciformis TaxID=546530 RepID=UPI002AE01956|nr:enkurin domain-containing protein 1-like [Nerophis lumbriciformis]XP_061784697.1 enkurin domain-containing protein 1-like [Nerophis lumbriciformis]